MRANNLSTGRAFEFETGGKEAGEIIVKDTTGVPFTTNATGKVANLNADKLDDKDSADFAADGRPPVRRGCRRRHAGREPRAPPRRRAATATTSTVTFNRDVSKCSFTATANGTAPDALAAQVAAATGTAATQVVVTEADGATPTAFHLQVIC